VYTLKVACGRFNISTSRGFCCLTIRSNRAATTSEVATNVEEGLAFETNGGSTILAYTPGMGTGKVHYDYERGQAALVIVCLTAPYGTPKHQASCTQCKDRTHGRTLINLSTDGLRPAYPTSPPAQLDAHTGRTSKKQQPGMCKQQPLPIALEVGQVRASVFSLLSASCFLLRSFCASPPHFMRLGWFGARAVHKWVQVTCGTVRHCTTASLAVGWP
jgi:hypothetical protein